MAIPSVLKFLVYSTRFPIIAEKMMVDIKWGLGTPGLAPRTLPAPRHAAGAMDLGGAAGPPDVASEPADEG